jgi:hypothetical protein
METLIKSHSFNANPKQALFDAHISVSDALEALLLQIDPITLDYDSLKQLWINNKWEEPTKRVICNKTELVFANDNINFFALIAYNQLMLVNIRTKNITFCWNRMTSHIMCTIKYLNSFEIVYDWKNKLYLFVNYHELWTLVITSRSLQFRGSIDSIAHGHQQINSILGKFGYDDCSHYFVMDPKLTPVDQYNVGIHIRGSKSNRLVFRIIEREKIFQFKKHTKASRVRFTGFIVYDEGRYRLIETFGSHECIIRSEMIQLTNDRTSHEKCIYFDKKLVFSGKCICTNVRKTNVKESNEWVNSNDIPECHQTNNLIGRYELEVQDIQLKVPELIAKFESRNKRRTKPQPSCVSTILVNDLYLMTAETKRHYYDQFDVLIPNVDQYPIIMDSFIMKQNSCDYAFRYRDDYVYHFYPNGRIHREHYNKNGCEIVVIYDEIGNVCEKEIVRHEIRKHYYYHQGKFVIAGYATKKKVWMKTPSSESVITMDTINQDQKTFIKLDSAFTIIKGELKIISPLQDNNAVGYNWFESLMGDLYKLATNTPWNGKHRFFFDHKDKYLCMRDLIPVFKMRDLSLAYNEIPHAERLEELVEEEDDETDRRTSFLHIVPNAIGMGKGTMNTNHCSIKIVQESAFKSEFDSDNAVLSVLLKDVQMYDSKVQINSIARYVFKNGILIDSNQIDENNKYITRHMAKELNPYQFSIGYKACITADNKMCLVTLAIPFDAKVRCDEDMFKFRTNKAVVKKIERIFYYQKRFVLSHEIMLGDTCPICVTELSDGIVYPCAHKFCMGCISLVLDDTNACPYCREKIERVEAIKFPQELIPFVNLEPVDRAFSFVYTSNFSYITGQQIEILDFDETVGDQKIDSHDKPLSEEEIATMSENIARIRNQRLSQKPEGILEGILEGIPEGIPVQMDDVLDINDSDIEDGIESTPLIQMANQVIVGNANESDELVELESVNSDVASMASMDSDYIELKPLMHAKMDTSNITRYDVTEEVDAVFAGHNIEGDVIPYKKKVKNGFIKFFKQLSFVSKAVASKIVNPMGIPKEEDDEYKEDKTGSIKVVENCGRGIHFHSDIKQIFQWFEYLDIPQGLLVDMHPTTHSLNMESILNAIPSMVQNAREIKNE